MSWHAMPTPVGGENLYPVYLFSDEKAYYRNGGVPGSAGVSIGAKSLALVSSLGVKDTGKRPILDDIEENTVLVHELTHSLRNQIDLNLPVWCIKGAAEYMASASYKKGGVFSFRQRLRTAVEYVETDGGYSEGEIIVPHSIETFLEMDRDQFCRGGDGVGVTESARVNYAMALLVFTWFWHEDQGKSGELKAGEPIRFWRRALIEGQSSEKASELLLDGRTAGEIQSAMVQSYPQKVSITFPE